MSARHDPPDAPVSGDRLPLVLTARGWAALARPDPGPAGQGATRYELTAAGRAALARAHPLPQA